MHRPFLTFTPSGVVSVIALIVALGGTSYAAVSLPRNSVGAMQVRPNAVSSAKVRDGSLMARDFRAGQIPAGVAGPAGAAGPPGLKGPAGPAGPAGPDGAAALPKLVYRVSEISENPPGTQAYGSAVCDSGMHVVGGGVYTSGGLDQTVNSSGPTSFTGEFHPRTWTAYVNNKATSPESFQVYAICTTASSVTLPAPVASNKK
jgi:hypothetical protein